MTRARDLADWGDQVPNAETAWTAYTPTWTRLTVGNATQDFAYKQIGKTVFVRFKLVFGSTTSITGTNPIFTLPVSPKSVYDGMRVNIFYIEDSGVAAYQAIIYTTTNGCLFYVLNANSTYVGQTDITSTSPFTWGTNDFFYGEFFYEAA